MENDEILKKIESGNFYVLAKLDKFQEHDFIHYLEKRSQGINIDYKPTSNESVKKRIIIDGSPEEEIRRKDLFEKRRKEIFEYFSNLLVKCKEYIDTNTEKINQNNNSEPLNNYVEDSVKLTNFERLYWFDKIGGLDLPIFKNQEFTNTNRDKILAKVLGINTRDIKSYWNQDTKNPLTEKGKSKIDKEFAELIRAKSNK